MMRKLTALILALMVLATSAMALADTEITVTGNGNVLVSADTAVVNIGVNIRNRNALKAQQHANELIAAVRSHYDGIRRCAVQTDDSIYSCGWLPDIARCIYTLRTGDVIGKTQAGEWALAEHLFSDEEPLKRTLVIRKDPLLFRDDPKTKDWLKTLGPTVQRYADVLERELLHYIS